MGRPSNKDTQQPKILAEAGRLFWEKGYEKTSMRDIAQACSFEPGNLYNYFRSKEEILYGFLRQESENLLVRLRETDILKCNSQTQCLRQFMAIEVAEVLGYAPSARLLFDAGLQNVTPAHRIRLVKLRDRADSFLLHIIHAGIQNGEFANNIDARLVCFTIQSAIVRSRIWFSANGRLSVDDISNSIFEIVLNGITACRAQI